MTTKHSSAVLVLALLATCGCTSDGFKPAVDDPKCYTPCRRGAVVDGEFIPCPPDGLMEACIGGTECRKGSCVAPDSKVPRCETDVDCPQFQTCLESHCYSNCEYDSECGAGNGCYMHVCRKACSSLSNSCPEGTYCSTLDGENGYCLPLSAPEGSQEEVIGSFELSKTGLTFSQVENKRSFVITNNAPLALDFTVRKIQHTEFTGDGVEIDTETPLYWLHMGQSGSEEQVEEFSLLVDGNGGEVTITIAEATTEDLPIWNGIIEVSSTDLGAQQVSLVYASRPEGQWSGKIYYFANFGTQGLDAWIADKDNPATLEAVHNAFIEKWGALRMGNITLDNFMAVLQSTRNESWKWATMKPPNCPKEACYPFDNDVGYGEYSDNLDSNPIPSGMVELPFAINIREDPSGSGPREIAGKISTTDTLHYAGDPTVRATLSVDSDACSPDVSDACMNFLETFESDIVVGGRYILDGGGCSLEGFEKSSIPWLVPGFVRATEEDADSGLRYRVECRDTLQPYSAPGMQDINFTFSGSNPLPDGRSRTRKIELVDGALVNQEKFVVIFKESFHESYSFVAPDDENDFTAFGVMVLERHPTTLEDADFVGSDQTETRTMPDDLLEVGCSEEIVMRALDTSYSASWETDSALRNSLAVTLIDGINLDLGPEVPILETDVEDVHYLCHDTGLIDSGHFSSPMECPYGSHVTFFTVNGTRLSQADIDTLPCQRDGSCQDTLDVWKDDPGSGGYELRLNPFWKCTTYGEVYCEANRWDLRDGKTFYAEASPATVFVPLLTEVNDAFRYKTAFMNRSGVNVGFAPEVCVPDSNVVPYCYNPSNIEEVQDRIDCALYLYIEHRDNLDATARAMLRDYLTINFSVDDLGGGMQRDGYEALNAELLVMMGDESYTSAFASRFDLAGCRRATFEGSLFEPDGINLSGVAGNEMYTLYQAAQYYQMALDRFYMMMPFVWESLGAGATDNFIQQETVTNYFDRLIRASTQKSRAWSEAAKRYQNFNRPDLARLVVERAYTSTYLESVLITRMMHKVVDVVNPEDKAQILYIIEQAQRQYKAALLDMRDVYKGITDEVNFFGFAPDYIPFPALDDEDNNAFEKLLDSAWQKTAFAAEKETIALEDSRAYETDRASFQAELVSIRNNYENQLAELCGTFEGADGHIYPAITKYAYLDEWASYLGNPCGMLGNGAIHEAMANIEIASVELQSHMKKRDDKLEEIDIELQRVSEYCDEIVETQDYVWDFHGEQITLQRFINVGNDLSSHFERRISQAQSMGELAKCVAGPGGTDCPQAAGAALVMEAMFWTYEIGIAISTITTREFEYEQMRNERALAHFELEQECDIAKIDSDAVVATLTLEHEEISLDILKAYYELQLAFSELEKLYNQAKRTEVEQQEVEELAINIEAARNDPNVRIYKNDAIINADRAFNSALREAYKATRVYEYYTSQTYEGLDKLFLIRMIMAGDYNLENYLMELEDAFYSFEEEYGNPDVRVAVLSLRDDVLNVPWLRDNGESLPESERLTLFREKLADPGLLDPSGYLNIPFSTNVDTLSPLTRNHKVYYLEAEFVGTDVGDSVGRIYLKQRGTGSVHSVTDETLFYAFPERTAVVNTFFNGERWDVFSDDTVFMNMRLRDRPYANTLWELLINQRDEEVNKDINLQSLTDVRLYVYYTDFTEM